MKSLKILLTDLKHFNEQSQYDLYIPLNLGYLASHLNRIFGEKVDVSMHLDPNDFLQQVIKEKPQVVGFSLYVWNTYVTKTMISYVREKLGNEVIIFVGGPSVDPNLVEQKELCRRLPQVDAFIQGEGEIGFENAIAALLDGEDLRQCDPIPGVNFYRGKELIPGGRAEKLNLQDVESPYLSGILDDYLEPPFKPMTQTTRGCPYRCTYCVLGNLMKVQKFSVEQIKCDINFIAEKYADHPHLEFFLVDDNFGLFKSDLEIAHYIAKTAKEKGYPYSLGYYSDKKYTEVVKGVSLSTKDLNNSFCVSLQSNNPETLKAIKRKNLDNEIVTEAVAWCKSNNLYSTTELIFGLPYETRKTFVTLLEKCINFGFDFISNNPLILLDGAALNSQESRRKFKFKTKYRLFMSNYGLVDNIFTCEAEEIVVSSHSFSYDDFIAIRYLNFMFYAVYRLRFQYAFFKELRHSEIKVTDFFHTFFHPDKNEKWPESYLKFLSNLKNDIVDELYDTKEELIKVVEERYRNNGCEVLSPTKINVNYGMRMVYQENEWVTEVFQRILRKYKKQIDLDKHSKSFDFLIKFYNLQLINPKKPFSIPEAFKSPYNIKEWLQQGASISIQNYLLKAPIDVKLHLNSSEESTISSFLNNQSALSGNSFYYAWVELLKRRLLYSFNL